MIINNNLTINIKKDHNNYYIITINHKSINYYYYKNH